MRILCLWIEATAFSQEIIFDSFQLEWIRGIVFFALVHDRRQFFSHSRRRQRTSLREYCESRDTRNLIVGEDRAVNLEISRPSELQRARYFTLRRMVTLGDSTFPRYL